MHSSSGYLQATISPSNITKYDSNIFLLWVLERYLIRSAFAISETGFGVLHWEFNSFKKFYKFLQLFSSTLFQSVSKQSLCSISLRKLFFSSFLRAFLCPFSYLLAISCLSSCCHSICLLIILIRASDESGLLPGLALLPRIPVHPLSLFQAALCKLLNESYAEILLLASGSQTLCLPVFFPPTARSPFPFSLQAFYSLCLDTESYPIIVTIC